MKLSWLIVMILFAGCAATVHPESAAPPPAEDDTRALAAAQAQLALRFAELDRLTIDAQKVDCPKAATLRDAICALTERICVLAARTPREPRSPTPCEDAQARCRVARERVAATCR